MNRRRNPADKNLILLLALGALGVLAITTMSKTAEALPYIPPGQVPPGATVNEWGQIISATGAAIGTIIAALSKDAKPTDAKPSSVDVKKIVEDFNKSPGGFGLPAVFGFIRIR